MSVDPHKQENSFSCASTAGGTGIFGSTFHATGDIYIGLQHGIDREKSGNFSRPSQVSTPTVDPILTRLASAISALEHYAEGSVRATSIQKYRNLRLFITNLQLQRLSLLQTLLCIEINGGSEKPGSFMQAIQHSASSKKTKALSIVQTIDNVVKALLQKLDVDELGIPKWTSTTPSGEHCAVSVFWDWWRVKNSLGRKDRARLVDQLKRHNAALASFYEEQGVPAADKPTGRMAFDDERCDQVRTDAYVLHKALQLSCLHPHNMHICLDDNDALPPTFDIVFDLEKKDPNGLCWTKTHVEHERQISRRGDSILTHNVDLRISQVSHRSPDTDLQSPLWCICQLMQHKPNEETLLPCVHGADSSERQALIRKLHDNPSTKPVDIRGMLARSSQISKHHRLSRIHRLGIAASIAWTVLHFGESPWLDAGTALESFHLFVSLNSIGGEQHQPRRPYILHELTSPLSQLDVLSDQTLADQQTDDQRQIVNPVLFRLGIVLIELCLGRPFSELRSEYLEDEERHHTATSDYGIAEELIDKIYNEAGDRYGYAVQRCIRCEFLGKSFVRTLGLAEFRKHFYEGVVAPIKKTFELQSTLD